MEAVDTLVEIDHLIVTKLVAIQLVHGLKALTVVCIIYEIVGGIKSK